jgi:hypothetical protein
MTAIHTAEPVQRNSQGDASGIAANVAPKEVISEEKSTPRPAPSGLEPGRVCELTKLHDHRSYPCCQRQALGGALRPHKRKPKEDSCRPERITRISA